MLELNEILKGNADYNTDVVRTSGTTTITGDGGSSHRSTKRSKLGFRLFGRVGGDGTGRDARRKGDNNDNDEEEVAEAEWFRHPFTTAAAAASRTTTTTRDGDVSDVAVAPGRRTRRRERAAVPRRLVLWSGCLVAYLAVSLLAGRRRLLASTAGRRFDDAAYARPRRSDGDRAERLRERLTTRFPRDDDPFADPASPRRRALDWIADRDGRRVDPDDPSLPQRYALAVLYYSTGGDDGDDGWRRPLNFLSAAHECEWSDPDRGGVRKCDDERRVVDLSLRNDLRGTLPPELPAALDRLEVLYLARNRLTGPVPAGLADLARLTYLGLQHNQLTGTLPDLSRLADLRFLFVEKNDLTGTIRRVDGACRLMTTTTTTTEDEVPRTGSLVHFHADCRSLLAWRRPEITCACCTKCYLA